LPQPFAVIGRDPQADVILDDLRVSRRHVYMQAVTGQVFWVDLESRTGTCDETGTRKWGWLAGGGLLEVGPLEVGLLEVGLLEVGQACRRTAHIYSYQPCFGKLYTEEIQWPVK